MVKTLQKFCLEPEGQLFWIWPTGKSRHPRQKFWYSSRVHLAKDVQCFLMILCEFSLQRNLSSFQVPALVQLKQQEKCPPDFSWRPSSKSNLVVNGLSWTIQTLQTVHWQRWVRKIFKLLSNTNWTEQFRLYIIKCLYEILTSDLKTKSMWTAYTCSANK